MSSQADQVAIVRSPTEERNTDTHDIDTLPTLDILRLINSEDHRVAPAVAAVLPQLAEAVDHTVHRLGAGGRVHYFGAGTSGRLAMMDAAELPPTYGVEPHRVVAHHAGGQDALVTAVEGIEDDDQQGAVDAADLASGDVAIGLSASGRTPYVAGALRVARQAGATTVLISANPHADLADKADIHVGMDTGAEVIAGSTRMKAGTAQKLALNALSTAVMIRLGHTYSNLMVGMSANNAKLRGRMVTILADASGQSAEDCASALAAANGETRTALVILLAGVDATDAATAVRAAGGSVRGALRELGGT
ncbi:N-acetylmuramic acid 6-phosphate etherase [Lipingzhangella sp. LS1_29]|uniref:N-acetylmuramic acid 6-phosphate etherase n=1 Tax=Lipingzhangella rawalii TaxID=2055835 RepID=A0ABU2HCL9_9ACTN|nr:N-acetylmuramic acid 6-phosphate etherase [Lipingzhangella rawalii]MDS1272604.1 N-acetylmuramic acid 6-phosphate etherase [Lipingzhangella rawalii]